MTCLYKLPSHLAKPLLYTNISIVHAHVQRTEDRLTLLIIFIIMYIFQLWTCPKCFGNGHPLVIGIWVAGYKISAKKRRLLPTTCMPWSWHTNEWVHYCPECPSLLDVAVSGHFVCVGVFHPSQQRGHVVPVRWYRVNSAHNKLCP